MKKFHFRLEAIEKHRIIQEKEKRVLLSKALEKLRSAEARLLELDSKEVEARKEFAKLGEKQNEKNKLGRFWILDQFIQGQKIRRLELKMEIDLYERELRAVYRDYLDALKKKKIIEKLRERTTAEFKASLKKYELKTQDDLYTMRNRIYRISSEESYD